MVVIVAFLSVQLLCQSFAVDFERWQRHREFLRRRQQRIRFPPLETIHVNGKEIKLPLRATEPTRSPSQREVDYLVGFFDGDGCVTMNKVSGEVHLSIGQSVDSAEALLRFRSLLGGSVSNLSTAAGSRKAAARWTVCGSKMTGAAETLSRVPSMKRAELRIARRGCVAATDRAMAARELRRCKQRNYVPLPLPQCSWPYFSGFFDAEGSNRIGGGSASCSLEVKHVNPCVLVQLLRFLQDNNLQSWSLKHYLSCSRLWCTDLIDCKKALKLLLANGLRAKARQAQLALNPHGGEPGGNSGGNLFACWPAEALPLP